MPSAYNFADWVTMEGLRMLLNDLTIAEHFNTDFNSKFTKSFPVGETVRVPLPQRFNITDGVGYQPQSLDRPVTSITVNQVFGVHFDTESVDRALKMERGREMFKREYLDRAMQQIAQEIDSRCALHATRNTPNVVGVLGVNPGDADIAGLARQRLIEMACPPGEKVLIISPSAMSAVVAGETTIFNPTGEKSRAYKEGYVGRARMFDWYESMSLYSHTAGTWAGTVETFGAGQSGGSLTLTCTAGDTFRKSDRFNVAGVYAVNPMTRRSTGVLKQFVITSENLTAVGDNTDVITFTPAIVGPGSHYQNVTALPGDDADLTLWPGTASPNGDSGTIGLALHRDAFALVGVNLDIPPAGVITASRARDPKTGIGVAFIEDWDQENRRRTHRFDVLLGFGNLHNDNAAVAVALA